MTKPGKESRFLEELAEAFFNRFSKNSRRATVLIGVKPLNALSVFYPEFNSAVVWLELRHRMSHAYPSVDANHLATHAALLDVKKILEATTDQHYEGVAKWLRETVGEVPASKSREDLLAAVRKQLDHDYPLRELIEKATKERKFIPKKVAVAKMVLPRAPVTSTAFDELHTLAERHGEVMDALHTFQRACVHEDPIVIRQTAQGLHVAIAEHAVSASRQRLKDAVEAITETFERKLVTSDALDAVLKFWQAFDKLAPTHPIVNVYARLHSWLTPDDFEQLGAIVARLPELRAGGTTKKAKAKLAASIAGRLNPLQGELGQLIGIKGPYRRTYEQQLRRAASFSESLAGKGYRVAVSRVPVRALASDGTFQLTYDEAIVLINDSEGKAALSFTAQFKTGYHASPKVFAQMDSDDIRESLGKLLVDGRQYDIVTGLTKHESTIVTSTLAAGEEIKFKPSSARSEKKLTKVAQSIGDREVQFLPLPPEPSDIRAIVRFFLVAAGKIPPD